MFVYFSADNLCPEERSSRLTVSYEEQIMSKDKFTRIFFRYKWRVLYLVSVLKLTHPLLLTRFFKIYFVVICSLKKKDVSISLLSDLFKGNTKKQFNKGQILKVNGLVQTGKGK